MDSAGNRMSTNAESLSGAFIHLPRIRFSSDFISVDPQSELWQKHLLSEQSTTTSLCAIKGRRVSECLITAPIRPRATIMTVTRYILSDISARAIEKMIGKWCALIKIAERLFF